MKNDNYPVSIETMPVIESDLESGVRKMREITDFYIKDIIERKAILSRNDCMNLVIRETGSKNGVCGYFMRRMKELGYKSKKVRFAEYDNPINVWVQDSSLF